MYCVSSTTFFNVILVVSALCIKKSWKFGRCDRMLSITNFLSSSVCYRIWMDILISHKKGKEREVLQIIPVQRYRAQEPSHDIVVKPPITFCRCYLISFDSFERRGAIIGQK